MTQTRRIKVLKRELGENVNYCEKKYSFLIGYGENYSLNHFLETDNKNLLEVGKGYDEEFSLSPGIPDFIGDFENEIVTMSESLEKIIDKESEEVVWERK